MRLPVSAALAVGLVLGLLGNAFASRNGAGTYSLPAGNPVTSGTTITSTWANNTLSDISTELTNSLDRSGRGAMTAPLQCSSGSVSAPAVTFSAETNSGLYRAASNDIRFAINGSAIAGWAPSGYTVQGTVTATPSNGVAIVGQGAGTDAGVMGVGGGTNGPGILGIGGATNGNGVVGVGTGTGYGGLFTGGSGVAAVVGVGTGTQGIGLYGTGSGNGWGVQGIGNGTGVGVFGTGGTTGAGGQFTAGTSATGGTRQTALKLTNGDLDLDGVALASTNTALKNKLTPNGLVKAYASVSLSGTGVQTINAGMNVSGASGSGPSPSAVTLTFTQAMASTSYVVLTSSSVGCVASPATRNTGSVVVNLSDPGGVGSCTTAAGAWNGTKVDIFVIGLQ